MAFQSTLPGWGATGYVLKHRKSKQFQSTLPGWGATRRTGRCHHVGSDFNPRSPDGERPSQPGISSKPERFQSTLPGWGATIQAFALIPPYGEFQSTLPGWGATSTLSSFVTCTSDFNPRSPDGERPTAPTVHSMTYLFQSTLPGWGATLYHAASRTTVLFQSTLPGWGATRDTPKSGRLPYNFNPRSPDGERHDFRHRHPQVKKFQSTLPGWGATLGGIVAGGEYLDFNPRSPDGERLWYAQSADC